MAAPAAPAAAFANPGMTEFVGTAFGDTIGIVIANLDPVVHEKMKLAPNTAPSVFSAPAPAPARRLWPPMKPSKPPTPKSSPSNWPAIPKAAPVTAASSSLAPKKFPTPAAPSKWLSKTSDRTFGDVYANDAGHIELQYTARASYACEKAFGAPSAAPLASASARRPVSVS
jgi:hypothetical protein